MGERSERAVLNRLIETCRDAERGFRAAADEARTAELRRLFLRLAAQRQAFAEELAPHACRLGARAGGAGTRVAAFHRAWMRLKARIASDPDRAIAEEALRGERFATAAYDAAVRGVLPTDTRDIVLCQDLGIRVAGRMVANMAAR